MCISMTYIQTSLLDDGSVHNAFGRILLSDRYGLRDLEFACSVRNSAP